MPESSPDRVYRIVDIETLRPPARRGEVVAVGSPAYVEGCDVICVVTRRADGTDEQTWSAESDEPLAAAAARLIPDGETAVAHNAYGFDAPVWDYRTDNRPPWADSLIAARVAGYPGGLDALSRDVMGDEGGKVGNSVRDLQATIDEYGLPRATLWDSLRNRGFSMERLRHRVRNVVEYCRRDVDLLARLWRDLLRPHWETLSARDSWEGRVLQADLAIQARGFSIDRNLARHVLALDTARASRRRQRLLQRYGVSDALLRSPHQLRAWLGARGYDLTTDVPDLRRDRVEGLIDEARRLQLREVEEVLLARIGETRITASKISTALGSAGADGSIERWGSYAAAHTLRWGGRGFQPQNLPRGVALDASDEQALVETVREGHCDADGLEEIAAEIGHDADDLLSHLVRAAIVPRLGRRFVIADWSQIEPRVLAWLAGDEEMLATFRRADAGDAGPEADIYVMQAARVFGLDPAEVTKAQRGVGKVLVLACGYQAGGGRFGTACAAFGVEMPAGMTAMRAVESYRASRPAIAGRPDGLWARLHDAVGRAAIDGESGIEIGRGVIVDGSTSGHVSIRVPSGGRLQYRRTRVVAGDYGPEVVWESPRGPRRLYGGSLTENVVQRIARDLLADALIRTEVAGLPVVLHVHDEIVCEVPEDDAEAAAPRLEQIMAAAPSWAYGLPLRAEAHVATRFGK